MKVLTNVEGDKIVHINVLDYDLYLNVNKIETIGTLRNRSTPNGYRKYNEFNVYTKNNATFVFSTGYFDNTVNDEYKKSELENIRKILLENWIVKGTEDNPVACVCKRA